MQIWTGWRSSPTTSTPSPSPPTETLHQARLHPATIHKPDSAASSWRGRFSPGRLSGASSQRQLGISDPSSKAPGPPDSRHAATWSSPSVGPN